jgi:hypothetical protein
MISSSDLTFSIIQKIEERKRGREGRKEGIKKRVLIDGTWGWDDAFLGTTLSRVQCDPKSAGDV